MPNSVDQTVFNRQNRLDTGGKLKSRIPGLLAGLAIVFAMNGAGLAHDWTVTAAEPPQIEDQIIYTAPGGLPDGEVAKSPDSTDITAAWYSRPTKRYRHGILGDTIEGGALTVQTPDGKLQQFVLPENQVFEDRTPRLHDLAGFGETRVITILSDLNKGASIAVFGMTDGKLTLVDQTPYIGKANRWRNIAGIADYDGDGKIQIAEVVTPHLGGTLKFWTWETRKGKAGKLVLSGELPGFSNHKIGSREQNLSVSEDFDNDGITDLALPSADRKSFKQVSFPASSKTRNLPVVIADIALPAPIDKKISVSVDQKTPVIHVGLENNSYWDIKH